MRMTKRTQLKERNISETGRTKVKRERKNKNREKSEKDGQRKNKSKILRKNSFLSCLSSTATQTQSILNIHNISILIF